MDIKGIARNILPLGPTKPDAVQEARTRSKTDANNDREGDGQATSDEDQRRRNLSPEEIQEAVKYLEGLPGVKENGLTLRLETKDGVSVVYIEDRAGKVVRRIPESELSLLTSNRQKKSGHLLNKAL